MHRHKRMHTKRRKKLKQIACSQAWWFKPVILALRRQSRRKNTAVLRLAWST